MADRTALELAEEKLAALESAADATSSGQIQSYSVSSTSGGRTVQYVSTKDSNANLDYWEKRAARLRRRGPCMRQAVVGD